MFWGLGPSHMDSRLCVTNQCDTGGNHTVGSGQSVVGRRWSAGGAEMCSLQIVMEQNDDDGDGGGEGGEI